MRKKLKHETKRIKQSIRKIDSIQDASVEAVQAFFANHLHIVYVRQEETNRN